MTEKRKKLVVKIIILIITIPLLCNIAYCLYIVYLLHTISVEVESEMHDSLEYVSTYVMENEKAFMDFSEYLLCCLNEDTTYIEAEPVGENQVLRDIAFGCFASVQAGTNGLGEITVNYYSSFGSYDIVAVYKPDGYEKSLTGDWKTVYINNNMYVYVIRMRF